MVEGHGDVFFLRLVRCLFFFDAFVKLNVKGSKAALVEALRDSAAPTFLLLMSAIVSRFGGVG